MTRVRAKIGTGPMVVVILWGSRLPTIGGRVRFRERADRSKWQRAICDQIKDIGAPLYLLTLM